MYIKKTYLLKSSFSALMLGALILITTSCSNQNELRSYELKGKVKSYIEQTYKAENESGKWVKGELYSDGIRKICFDKKGLFSKI